MRTQELINQEYTHCAALCGDMEMKRDLLAGQIGQLKERMKLLMAEKPDTPDVLTQKVTEQLIS